MRIIDRAPLAAPVNANVTTAQIFAKNIDVTKACILTVHGTSVYEQKKLIVRASGLITTHAATNVTVTLYKGTTLVAGTNTVLKASTATAQDGSGGIVKRPWWLEAALILTSTADAAAAGGALDGKCEFHINNTVVAAAAITELLGVDGAGEPALNLCVGITFSVANVDNAATLSEFAAGF